MLILHFQTYRLGNSNTWCRKYKNLIGTLEIRLKIIVLTNYRGNTSHVNFAKFFVLNARMLESMKLEFFDQNSSSAWIERQHGLLQIKNKASGNAHFHFVGINSCINRYDYLEQVHDLSTTDPFLRFHNQM
jgi:hypothetical protein